MKFNLLLTNKSRVRWLWWGLLGGLLGGIGLLALGWLVSFGLVMGLPVALLVAMLFIR